MSKRSQPVRPEFICDTYQLKLYNSLTKQKEVFHPKNGREIKWYCCGPTVYDASHMGHARSYMSFDILRRILSKYFGYGVTYVMNITDIDDKIIKRARQNHLFAEYIKPNRILDDVLADVECTRDMLTNAIKNTRESDINVMLTNSLDKVLKVEKTLMGTGNKNASDVSVLYDIKDSLSEYLDMKNGKNVTDNSIFSKLARYWEDEFHEDMEKLNILKPTTLTRVSEYIPEIINYIEKIIQNGLAYESKGSVYFDVAEFDKKPNHFYAKLVPEAYGDTKSLQDGEGDLFSDDKEKKSPTDFALWKASKPGEPWWSSPWGNGRPGWHIECSVMASTILGAELDIHTGGVDLKFPHHDNELAQAEAYFDNDCWVRYFLHSGHLTIAGCKMSKSLKNFITIKDALKKYSARQLRFAFLLHKWNDTLDFSENTMEMAITYEKLLNEFFMNVKNVIKDMKDQKNTDQQKKWTQLDLIFNLKCTGLKQAVHEALCDNIDTRRVLDAIRDCINSYNVYIKNSRTNANLELVKNIGVYVTELMHIFGTIPSSTKIGFPISSNVTTANLEEIQMPILTALAEFRHSVRQEAITSKMINVLKECDRLRDEVLPNLGVRLEDREGRCATIKLIDRETLRKEREEKERIERKKAEEKSKKLAQQTEKDDFKKIPPSELFKRETNKYSKFDEKGFPTHDVQGNKLSKGLIKKLQKVYFKQEKNYMEYMQSLVSDRV